MKNHKQSTHKWSILFAYKDVIEYKCYKCGLHKYEEGDKEKKYWYGVHPMFKHQYIKNPGDKCT